MGRPARLSRWLLFIERPTLDSIKAAGFTLTLLEHTALPKAPKFVRPAIVPVVRVGWLVGWVLRDVERSTRTRPTTRPRNRGIATPAPALANTASDPSRRRHSYARRPRGTEQTHSDAATTRHHRGDHRPVSEPRADGAGTRIWTADAQRVIRMALQ